MMAVHKNDNHTVLFLAQFSILLAIEAIVCFTPLGSLPAFGPIGATLSHIPVIIAAILLGTRAGMGMGFFFGLFRFLTWTFAPSSPIAFVFTPFYSVGSIHGNFWSIVICFAPRILIGFTTGMCFKLFTKLFSKKGNQDVLLYGLSGFLGSLTNTVLVLSGIFVFFGNDYASVLRSTYRLLIGIIGMTVLTNGIPEAFIGAIAAYTVCRPLKKYAKQRL